MVEQLNLSLEYVWEPFTVKDAHLTFQELTNTRLNKAECSHWGIVVYKWEGFITKGANTGNIGVLIGETTDLRQRIKQYISGTQKCGNKYWREQFLTKGEVRLHILRCTQEKVRISGGELPTHQLLDVGDKNVRHVVEQLLVLHEALLEDKDRWIVNRKV